MEKSNLLNPEIGEKLAADKEVIAVFLFGSLARGEKNRDIDLCIVLDKKYDNLMMSNKRVLYASMLPSIYDVSVFQQLPLYIRKRILKEGKIMFCKNEDMLYEIAFLTIKEFNLFRRGYYDYLQAVQNKND